MGTERDDDFNRIDEALRHIESYCGELEKKLKDIFILANSTSEFSEDAVAMDTALTNISLIADGIDK